MQEFERVCCSTFAAVKVEVPLETDGCDSIIK